MKTGIRNRIAAGICFALLFPLLPTIAEENTIALGGVTSGGTIFFSNTALGTLSSVRSSTGVYDIDLNAPGAFAGAGFSDFFIEAGEISSTSFDVSTSTQVTAITDDQLSVRVTVNDLEDSTDTSQAEARNAAFYFVIHRIPANFPSTGDSRFLIANGRVLFAGSLFSSASAIPGVTISSSHISSGEYSITLSKPGGFVSDTLNDYIVIAKKLRSPGALSSVNDHTAKGSSSSVDDDHSVDFTVQVDDLQNETDDDNPVPQQSIFSFSIYRVTPADSSGRPKSRLLRALARVQGSDGSLLSTPLAFDGGALSSMRNSEGSYTLTITSPGAFAGKDSVDFLSFAQINQGGLIDEVAVASHDVVDANTLTIEVETLDVEQAGADVGIHSDASFFVQLVATNAAPRPDLLIGERSSPARMRGNNRYNRSGGGQRIRLDLPGTREKKFHFILENDGLVSDTTRLRARGAGNRMRTKFFRKTGGRRNITGRITRSGFQETEITPGERVRFEGRLKYKRADRRPRRNVRLIANSLPFGFLRDTNKVRTLPK